MRELFKKKKKKETYMRVVSGSLEIPKTIPKYNS